MVRRNNEPISGADKAKVRVFFAEVEGNKRERTRSAENDAIGDEPACAFFFRAKG